MKLARAVLVVTSIAASAVVVAACSGSKSSSKPGVGEVTFADVRGTAYVGTTGSPAFGTHLLDVVVRLPKNAPKLDATSDFVEDEGVPPQGCRVRHFGAGADTADADSGTVSISGYQTDSTAAFVGTTPRLVSSPISCTVGSSGSYGCRMALQGTAGSANVHDVVFPAFPYEVVKRADPSVILATIPPPEGWPHGETGCIKRFVDNPQEPNPSSPTTFLVLCEQAPTLSVSEISEQVAGGSVYGATSTILGSGNGDFPFRLVPTSAKSGATEVSTTDPYTGGVSLDFSDGSLAAAAPFTMSYVCLSTTSGLGCVGNVAELRLLSSPVPKTSFTADSVDGEIECFSPITVASNSATMSMTVSAAQMTALIGGKSGGSVRMELINLARKAAPDGTRTVDFGAGAGVFGSVNE